MTLLINKTKPLEFCKRKISVLYNLRNCNKNSCSDDDEKPTDEITLPSEPQNCCMSGCANCVWVAYAEELAKILNDGGEAAKQKILENVKDPNLRAFILLELSHLWKK